MYLNDLPSDHPDRNRPLVGCFYKHRDAKVYREVLPTYKIAQKTFNQLGPSWTTSDVFTYDPARPC